MAAILEVRQQVGTPPFVACAAGSGYIPALRASRLDPMAALRYE